MPASSLDADPPLEALRSGNRDAFAQLVRRHHHALLAVARGLLREHGAEEAVQEAWIAAYRAITGFEGRSSLRTWLTRIVINQAFMRRRKVGSEPLPLTLSDDRAHPMEERFAEDGHWLTPPGHWREHAPDALLEQHDLLNCLEKTLYLLPDAQRLVLQLRGMQGLPLDEICNMLQLSASNTRVLLHRARTRVFGMVDHYQETGEC